MNDSSFLFEFNNLPFSPTGISQTASSFSFCAVQGECILLTDLSEKASALLFSYMAALLPIHHGSILLNHEPITKSALNIGCFLQSDYLAALLHHSLPENAPVLPPALNPSFGASCFIVCHAAASFCRITIPYLSVREKQIKANQKISNRLTINQDISNKSLKQTQKLLFSIFSKVDLLLLDYPFHCATAYLFETDSFLKELILYYKSLDKTILFTGLQEESNSFADRTISFKSKLEMSSFVLL